MILRICILFLILARLCQDKVWATASLPGDVVTFPTLTLAEDMTQRIDCDPSTPDVDNHPRSPFLPNSSEPTVLASGPSFLRRLQDESLCPQSSETIDTIQLQKYKSWWPHWRHEFIVISFACRGENYFMHLDRSWEGTGWREWIPLPTFGSTKPAVNSVTIHYQKDPYVNNTTEVIAQLDFHYRPSFRDISEPLSHVLLNAGSYSLFGLNCWSWSRFLYSSIARSTRDFILAVHQTRDNRLSSGRRDPWLEYGKYRFENGTKPSIRARIPVTAPNKMFQEPRLSLTVYTHYDAHVVSQVYSRLPHDQEPPLMLDESRNHPPRILDFLSQSLPRSPEGHCSMIFLNYKKGSNNNQTCETSVIAAIVRPYSGSQADYLAISFHKIPSYALETTMILFSGHPLVESLGASDEIAVWVVGCWLENEHPSFVVDRRTEFRYVGSSGMDRSSIWDPIPVVSRSRGGYHDISRFWSKRVPTPPAKGCHRCPWDNYIG